MDNQTKVCELNCNIDDMSGEALGFAMDKLFESGALDVFYIPIYMKKNRPGVLLRVICPENEKDRFSQLILKYTTTRGLRYQYYYRDVMESEFLPIRTEYGTVNKKVSKGFGITKEKYEYDDLCSLAENMDVSLKEAADYIKKNEQK